MSYSDEGTLFHEQHHGYKIGQNILGGKDRNYKVEEEVTAYRREFCVLNENSLERGEFLSKGFENITEENFVAAVINMNNLEKNFAKKENYLGIVNAWLDAHGRGSEKIGGKNVNNKKINNKQ